MTQRVAADIEGSQVQPPTFVQPVTGGGEDPTDDGSTNAPDQGSRNQAFQFTAEQVEKFRREEREKAASEKARLKAQLDEARKEAADFANWKAEQEKIKAAEARKAAKKQRQSEESEMSAKEILARRDEELESINNQWEQRFAQLEKQREQEKAQLALERQVMALQSFIQRRVTEEVNSGAVASHLAKYVTGSTEEEVEASIELAKQTTAEIAADLRASQGGQPPASQQTLAPGRTQGVSVAQGPSNFGSQSDAQSDEIDYTQLSMKDYLEKVRPKLGIGGNQQGLFS